MPNPMKPVDNTSPDASRASYTLGPIEGDIEPLPTWNADEIPKDARIAKVADAETNGDYTSLGQNGSNPHVLEDQAPAAHFDSDKLHAAGGKTNRHPYVDD